LMQGAPVADILYLTTEGAPAVFVPPPSAFEGTDTLPDKRGYSFDACSPAYLIKNASVVNNKIIFPSGASYSILVLPESRTMTPELLEKIDFMLKTGAYIAGYMPVSSPSLSGFPDCDVKVRSMAEAIWSIKWNPGRSSVRYLNGTLFKMDENTTLNQHQLKRDKGPYDIYPGYDTIASLLRGAGVDPDFSCTGGQIRYHHRRLPGKEIYFISNRSGRTITDTCRFRDGTAWGELWDPLTGKIRELKNITTTGKAAFLPVVLEPYAAYFIIFHRKEAISVIKSGSGNDFPPKDTLLELKGPWEMNFHPAAGGPGKIMSDTLLDWSLSDIEGIKYYSGKAICSGKFSLPGDILKKKENKFYISAVPLNGMAKVTVNGKTAGIVWTYPFELEITPYLKAGENKLEIEVANLWINRLIGDENMPWDGIENGRFPEWYLNKTDRPTGRITFTTHRYWKKDDKLISSGISQPVRILVSGPE
ncbi:MAG: glycosyl hydrolase, partial [Bacteroidales bacterium]|nr:glycosyl hydrolase [Bacteroidales bacterium]